MNTASGGVQFYDADPVTITGITNNVPDGSVTVITAAGMQIAGAISVPTSTASEIVSLLDKTANIQETGGGVITANTLIAQSQTGTSLASGANAIGAFIGRDGSAANGSASGGIVLTSNTVMLVLASVVETGGLASSVQISNTGGILLGPAQSIQTGGSVTLDVGTGNTGSFSVIAGMIASSDQAAVNGTGGGNVLDVKLATASQFPSAGLIFNCGGGDASNPNVLDITNPTGAMNNFYCIHESALPDATIYHGTSPNDRPRKRLMPNWVTTPTCRRWRSKATPPAAPIT